MVEDNAGDIGLVREALEEHLVRCEVAVVTNGERAIELIDQMDSGELSRPNLAIIDLNLPKKPGTEVLRRLRSSVCSGIPLIVLTSSDSQKDKADVAPFKPTHYIRKPSKLEEFVKLGAIFKQILYPDG